MRIEKNRKNFGYILRKEGKVYFLDKSSSFLNYIENLEGYELVYSSYSIIKEEKKFGIVKVKYNLFNPEIHSKNQKEIHWEIIPNGEYEYEDGDNIKKAKGPHFVVYGYKPLPFSSKVLYIDDEKKEVRPITPYLKTEKFILREGPLVCNYDYRKEYSNYLKKEMKKVWREYLEKMRKIEEEKELEKERELKRKHKEKWVCYGEFEVLRSEDNKKSLWDRISEFEFEIPKKHYQLRENGDFYFVFQDGKVQAKYRHSYYVDDEMFTITGNSEVMFKLLHLYATLYPNDKEMDLEKLLKRLGYSEVLVHNLVMSRRGGDSKFSHMLTRERW